MSDYSLLASIKFKRPVRIKSIRIREPKIKISLRKFDWFIT